MDDLVSIIMPSYNMEKYIAETIQSVMKQYYSNWELIIIDDCSTDRTSQIITSFNDKRIRYYRNTKNCGAALSRNIAIDKSRGRWIAFLDSDDLWHPMKLKKQIGFMLKYGYSFTYTNYSEIDEYSRPLGITVTGPKKITKTGMYNYCWPGCLTVMYDTQKIGKVQIKDIKKNNDYAMWLKISQKSDCYLLDKTLAQYRKRSGSISNHGYTELIKWHYQLFKDVDGHCTVVAIVYTLRNLLFGIWKKLKYVKREIK